LLADLSQLNTQVAGYILRHLDADAGQAESIPAGEERGLGERLAALAARLRIRAERRDAAGTKPLTVKGDVETRPQISDGSTKRSPSDESERGTTSDGQASATG
jgi:hypothetical protein